MRTKNNKQKNSTEAKQKEAVGLMGWLGATETELANKIREKVDELNQLTKIAKDKELEVFYKLPEHDIIGNPIIQRRIMF